MIQAQFSGERVVSNAAEAFAYSEKSSFGEKSGQVIEYALVEALFLVEDKKMQVSKGKKLLSHAELITKVRKLDKKIETKLAVYTDLRKRGYICKTALKYGADFRVYNKGVKPGGDHARWIVYTTREHDTLSWHEFAAKNRIAHSTKKHLLIAVVDEEGDVSYYEIGWLKP